MSRLRAFLLGALVLGSGVALPAQTLVMGNLPPGPFFGFNPGPVTAIDFATPASAAGTITSATFTYSLAPCAASVKIKFFRPSGANLVFVAERGPFDVTALTQTVPISPAVAVQVGDLVGIARVSDCGSPVGQINGAAAGFVAYGADIISTVSVSAGTRFPNLTLSVQATGTIAGSTVGAVAAVIPVVISTAGVGPSFFRTSIQLTNPGTTSISGLLVFHRAEVSGTASDPSLSYALGPGQTQSIFDFLPAIGQSGIGSVDVIPSSGAAPVALVRVYNDAGPAGTTGFTEDIVLSTDYLNAGNRAVLIAPPDLSLFRLNIGVRTLASGAALTITVRDAIGAVRRTLTKSYGPNVFTQAEASAFLGIVPGPSDSITIDVTSGSAVAYGATADNRTQDPSMQLGRRN